jgi:hypothetical protein
METRSFQPLYTISQPGIASPVNGTLVASVTIAASGTAAGAQLPGSVSANGTNQIQIANTTTNWAYCNFGQQGSVTAATVAAGFPVAPGAAKTITVNAEVSAVSVILGGGSGNVIFTRGEGL